MDHWTIIEGMQKWRWLFAVLGALVLVFSCVVTSAPDERREIEQAFRSLPEVKSYFGEVYVMSSTMKPARVQWIGEIKSGHFVYDVRGRLSRCDDLMISWEKRSSDGPVTLTKIATAAGLLIYPKKEPNQSSQPTRLAPRG